MIKNNIEQLRVTRKLTMKDLAELVGTSQQQIDRLEKGKRKISAEWMQKLSTALNCQPIDIVNFSSDKKLMQLTSTTEVLGAIETRFGNNVREFSSDEKYQITFRPAKKDLHNKFFALVVEGGKYKNYPENSELIFKLNRASKIGSALHEDSAAFIAKTGSNISKFRIGNEILEGELVKSIRNEN